MNELRRFELVTSLVLFAFMVIVATALLGMGHPGGITGLVAGALLGLANLTWMVGSARRFMGSSPTAGMLQLAAAVRFLTIVGLFGGILIIGRVDPVGAVIGYGCFPIAGAVGGWWVLRMPRGLMA
jgi:hypothetical protein